MSETVTETSNPGILYGGSKAYSTVWLFEPSITGIQALTHRY